MFINYQFFLLNLLIESLFHLTVLLISPRLFSTTGYCSANSFTYFAPDCLAPLHCENSYPISFQIEWDMIVGQFSFQIEWDMIVMTVFISILNQMDFHLVQNPKESLAKQKKTQ